MAPFPWGKKKLKHSLLSNSWLQMQYDQLLQAPDVGLVIISPSFCKLLLTTILLQQLQENVTPVPWECSQQLICHRCSNSVSSQCLFLLTPFSLVSVFHFPAIFLICDTNIFNCDTEWHILDHRGLCCCPVVTGLWLYSQRSSYHCSAISLDLTCGTCIFLFYRMTLTFIFSQNEKFLLPRKAIKFCLPSRSNCKYHKQLSKIMWKSIL